MISACGGLRFSQVAPGIGDFHPKKICVFPINTGAYTEVGNIADNLIADAVCEQGCFSGVIAPGSMTKLMENNDNLKHTVMDYLAKLKKVNFSDPDMSRYIGKRCNVDALLVVDVDFWNYTTQGDDKLAKVGFSMDLIEAQTGKIMWKAKHYDTKSYKWFKPDLADLAEGVAEEMISHMPH
ncbi:MAG: hypothetical protein U9N37_04405 [Thermodesulfobacteriota bacterium]|nr:hypothetical protein [Thermodesulfobacteriota bacterium]